MAIGLARPNRAKCTRDILWVLTRRTRRGRLLTNRVAVRGGAIRLRSEPRSKSSVVAEGLRRTVRNLFCTRVAGTSHAGERRPNERIIAVERCLAICNLRGREITGLLGEHAV